MCGSVAPRRSGILVNSTPCRASSELVMLHQAGSASYAPRAFFFAGTQQAYASDYNVEVAQASAIADPVVDNAPERRVPRRTRPRRPGRESDHDGEAGCAKRARQDCREGSRQRSEGVGPVVPRPTKEHRGQYQSRLAGRRVGPRQPKVVLAGHCLFLRFRFGPSGAADVWSWTIRYESPSRRSTSVNAPD